MTNTEVTLEPLTVDQYISLRERNFSEVMNRLDPFRPKPEVNQEVKWWREKVELGLHELQGIFYRGKVVGLVHAFDFDKEARTCEIGFGIFEEENHKKGIGKQAAILWIEHLRSSRGVRTFVSETNCQNETAVGLLHKIGFEKTGNYEDDGVVWVVLERKLEESVTG